MPPLAFSEEREKAWLALLLAWVAGFADSFGFVTLDGIFTSHISGNSVSVSALLAQRHWSDAGFHACAILSFISGFFIGMVIEAAGRRLRVRRRFGLAVALEAGLLLVFLFFGEKVARPGALSLSAGSFFLLLALLAGAMGVQSASLRRVRGQSVHTPYVTGMLTQSMENAVALLFNGYDRWRRLSPEAAAGGREHFSRMIFYGGIWLLFVIGSVCGGWGEQFWKFNSMFVPIGVLLVILICDLFRPIHD